MSNDELRFVNAFIGFCIPAGGSWPAPFSHLQYVPVGIEKKVTTLSGSKPQDVVPELICASVQASHAFLLEAKSATVDERQGRAYATISSNELVTQGLMPADMDSPSLTHDAIYICLPGFVQRIQDEFDRMDLHLPLVSGDQQEFRLARGALSQEELNRTFVSGIDVRDATWPMHFVPVTGRSSDAELAPFVIRAASQFVINGAEFSVQDVAQQSIPHWDLCGQAEQQAFRTKLTSILQEAEREELASFYTRLYPRQAWKPNRGPVSSSQTLMKLSASATEFVRRKQLGIPFHKDQPSLFSDNLLD